MQIISRAEGGELSRADVARINDIEYILMDDIAEALLDRPAR
jgi:hypothetical protein